MPAGQRGTDSRAGSVSSVATNESQTRNAALLGAAKAFGGGGGGGGGVVKSKPKPSNAGDWKAGFDGAPQNGALAAARGTRVPAPDHGGYKRATHLPPPINRGSGDMDVRAAAARAQVELGRHRLAVPQQLQPQPQQQRPQQADRSRLPSFYAAQLAAARSPEPVGIHASVTGPAAPRGAVKRPPVAPKPRRLSGGDTLRADDSPIPATDSLVKLFERKASGSETPKRPSPIAIRPSSDLVIRSPKPTRMSDAGISSVFQMEMDTPKASRANANRQRMPQHDRPLSDDESYVSISEDTAEGSPLKMKRTRSSSASRSQEEGHLETARPYTSYEPAPHRASRVSPPTRGKPVEIPKPSGRSAASPPMSFAPSAQSSSQSLTAQWHRMNPQRRTPLQSDDIANAIVASSLASSRAPSPRKSNRLEPPPVPSRRRHHTLSFARSPSPARQGMRMTLRKHDSSDTGEEDSLHPYSKHRKKRHLRKHPNKHHEGDRKRWRDAVTERERKRYEGVWAANKGILCTLCLDEEERLKDPGSFHDNLEEQQQARESAFLEMDQEVSSLVVRDIWSRSRLPTSELEMVWELVDNTGVGRLSKEEFVVGMWLVDQRLKGRKLPVRVSPTVWASVRSLQGIKIRK
ncbi:hypothetical protein D0863_00598 [Hortaea werneckii]|uniref:EH domain-containing protein n=1 Tax=Hortaea werneckii TaxID=91943 RepID=A0A3M7EQI4_HORWE|nr:hypothetical protein D0863_00598 [Hortaea werneckii]